MSRPNDRIRRLLDDYGAHHRAPGNKVCHYVGIPMIVLSLLGLLARVPLGPYDGGIVLLAGSTVAYLCLDCRYALMMLGIGGGLYAAGGMLGVGLLAGLQGFGWLLQFVGHGLYERRRPAFLQNALHLLVGPLWILDRVVGRYSSAASVITRST